MFPFTFTGLLLAYYRMPDLSLIVPRIVLVHSIISPSTPVCVCVCLYICPRRDRRPRFGLVPPPPALFSFCHLTSRRLIVTIRSVASPIRIGPRPPPYTCAHEPIGSFPFCKA